MRHLNILRRFLFTDNWIKELGSEVAGGSEDSQQTQPKSKTQLSSTERPVKSEQPSGSLTQEIEKGVLFGCESTDVSTGRLVKSCVPVSVERLYKDKDADENVDADQINTGRPVESEQSIDLFTQREEIDIDFRVSGLPHAVVKQAENFRVRELVKKIENHPHREALQADLQQNNVFNPFSNNSKAMIREMGNSQNAMLRVPSLLESRSDLLHPWTSLGRKRIQLKFSQMADALSIPHYVIKKGRPHGARHGKTEAQKKISWSTTRGRDVSRFLMEFTIVSNENQYIVIRNSKLAGPRRSASQWINWHRKTTPTAHLLRSMRDIRKTGISH